MDFSKPELKTLLALALTSTAARPASIKKLLENKRLYRRESEGNSILAHLAQSGFITVDRLGDRVHLLQSRLVEILGLAASTTQGHLFQDERELDGALAEICASGEPERPPPRAETPRATTPQLNEHLGNAEEKSVSGEQLYPSQFPSVQLPGSAESAPVTVTVAAPAPAASRPNPGASAERIVALLEAEVQRRGDPADLALWQNWAGWWHTVARNNPDRIERAYEKAQRVPGLRKIERFMRKQISVWVQEGLG